MNTICVYCSSSNAVAPHYFEAAREFGRLMAARGLELVYGGGSIGLMGELARAVHEHQGRVVGVIPVSLRLKEVAYEAADELIVTKDLRERKAIMDQRAEAFVALPGGFGTLEETIEILTLKQLHYHAKPVVFLNTSGFYDALLQFFEQFYREKFVKEKNRHLYHVAATPEAVFAYLDTYQPPKTEGKWFA
ncbi:MAG: TIGR00730 family Rossman fold protein [Verrucomicrobiota bacterium]